MPEEYVSFITADGVRKRRVCPFPMPVSGTLEDGLAPCLLARGHYALDRAQPYWQVAQTIRLLEAVLTTEGWDADAQVWYDQGPLN